MEKECSNTQKSVQFDHLSVTDLYPIFSLQGTNNSLEQSKYIVREEVSSVPTRCVVHDRLQHGAVDVVLQSLEVFQAAGVFPGAAVGGLEHFVPKTEFQKVIKMLVPDRLRLHLENEAILESIQLGEFWDLIGGREKHLHRDRNRSTFLVELSLVDDGQESVQDSTVGLENLIQKYEPSGWEFSLHPTKVSAVFQLIDINGTDDLTGLSELGEHILEVLTLTEAEDLGKFDDQVTLGCSRTANQKERLLSHTADRHQVYDLLFPNEIGAEVFPHTVYSITNLFNFGCFLSHCSSLIVTEGDGIGGLVISNHKTPV